MGTKSGQFLLKSDFIEKFGNDSRGLPSTLANKNGTLDASKNNLKDPSSPFNKYGSQNCISGTPFGKVRFNTFRAKDPIKANLVEKSRLGDDMCRPFFTGLDCPKLDWAV